MTQNFDGKPLEKSHFEDREGDWRIILNGILDKRVVRMRDGCNWLSIVSSSGLLY
jgi:hypothetical protein